MTCTCTLISVCAHERSDLSISAKRAASAISGGLITGPDLLEEFSSFGGIAQNSAK